MKDIKNKILSRRGFFKMGVGTAGTLAATSALARVCGISTGAQPLGPFFPNQGTPIDEIRENPDPQTPIALANDNDLTFVQGRFGKATGQVVYVKGQVTDAFCKPISGAMIVIWQASSTGRYNHQGDGQNWDFKHPKTGATIQRILDPFFQYWGRTETDANGEYKFKTVVPGFYPADLNSGWYRPPHIHMMVSAMGKAQFVTQSYFRGEKIIDNEFIQELNEKDFLLQSNSLTIDQRRKLVVDFSENTEFNGGLAGTFDIQLP